MANLTLMQSSMALAIAGYALFGITLGRRRIPKRALRKCVVDLFVIPLAGLMLGLGYLPYAMLYSACIALIVGGMYFSKPVRPADEYHF